MLRILAFDLGSNLGIAHNGAITGVTCEHLVFEGGRPERFRALLRYLTKAFKNYVAAGYDFDAVVYERPFARGFHATRSLWGTAGILEAVAAQYWPVLDVTPSEIKKFVAGTGRADKPAMIAAAQKLGYKGTDEHEADAFCLLKYALKYVEVPHDPKTR